jgi:hypothetical protein
VIIFRTGSFVTREMLYSGINEISWLEARFQIITALGMITLGVP